MFTDVVTYGRCLPIRSFNVFVFSRPQVVFIVNFSSESGKMTIED